MTDDKLNQIHENLTNQVSVYIRGIISKYGEYMVPVKVEYLKSIKDYSKIVKIYDYGSINGYANSDGIYMPLCADKVLEKVSKIPGYGINKKHQTYNDNTLVENNNTFVNYVYHIFVSGTDAQRYYDDLLLHETLHFCGSGGSFAISEGINELLTRQIAHEFGYHTNGCAYPNEVEVALRLSKVFGSDVITRLAFIRSFKQSLDYLDMTLGSAASSLYNDVMIAMEDEFQEKYYKNMDSYNGLVGIARKTIDYRKINYKKANELIDEYEKKLSNPEQQHSK